MWYSQLQDLLVDLQMTIATTMHSIQIVPDDRVFFSIFLGSNDRAAAKEAEENILNRRQGVPVWLSRLTLGQPD
jgi:hypothetical protein